MKPFCLSPFLLIACFKLVVAASKADAAESRAERTLVSATANILGKPGSGVLFPVETEDPFLAETPLGVFDDVAIEYVALDAPVSSFFTYDRIDETLSTTFVIYLI